MNLKKNHYSRRALALLLTLVMCVGMIPTAFAAQQNSYHDPAEHWMQASGRTNELDANSVVTRETFKCGECGKATSFEVFRVPEYTRNGQPALSRNVKYSDGTMVDGVGKGDTMDGIPGKDATYTGYHYTKAVCETCGGINTNMSKSEYGYLKNVYWLYDCAAAFTQELDETVSYEYTDDTYHTVTTKGGTYCAFCYGTNHTVSRKLERHSMVTEVLPQPANGRFATVEKCSLCDYARYDYTAAKAVIADYYGVVDGKPHTITVSDLSEAGVRTSIRYGNSADSCTMTSAPNYTEAGQYMVYYEITYTYKGKEMTENGVAKVWLRDESTKDDGSCAWAAEIQTAAARTRIAMEIAAPTRAVVKTTSIFCWTAPRSAAPPSAMTAISARSAARSKSATMWTPSVTHGRASSSVTPPAKQTASSWSCAPAAAR